MLEQVYQVYKKMKIRKIIYKINVKRKHQKKPQILISSVQYEKTYVFIDSYTLRKYACCSLLQGAISTLWF